MPTVAFTEGLPRKSMLRRTTFIPLRVGNRPYSFCESLLGSGGATRGGSSLPFASQPAGLAILTIFKKCGYRSILVLSPLPRAPWESHHRTRASPARKKSSDPDRPWILPLRLPCHLPAPGSGVRDVSSPSLLGSELPTLRT